MLLFIVRYVIKWWLSSWNPRLQRHMYAWFSLCFLWTCYTRQHPLIILDKINNMCITSHLYAPCLYLIRGITYLQRVSNSHLLNKNALTLREVINGFRYFLFLRFQTPNDVTYNDVIECFVYKHIAVMNMLWIMWHLSAINAF